MDINTNHKTALENLLDFYIQNAYQSELGAFLSDINNEGNVVSGKIYNVALSRLIYGLSFSSSISDSNMSYAEKASQFQLSHLTAKDSLGGYFVSYYDTELNKRDNSIQLDIWQQAYGLCGLSELYRQESSEKLLANIHEYHNGFTNRFHDEKHGGFYGNYNMLHGKVSGSKSLQSLMYPITAYMENLWIADTANRHKYEPYLKENLEIIFNHAWNKELGWVNIKFDDAWTPCTHPSAEKPCFTVSPGHNYQLASLFLRTKNWHFLNTEEKAKYKTLGFEIIETTLSKRINKEKDLSQGFYSEVNPLNNTIIDDRKTWWQHCEALIALSLSDGAYNTELAILEKFYFEAFTDNKHGGEFFYIDANNVPQTDEMKGNIGKSTYHTTEMIRYLNNESAYSGI